jgi:hypothetical protein
MDKTVKSSKMHSKYEPRVIGSHVPWLSLSGLWLEKAGFSIGQKIEITVTEKELRIKAV